MTREEAIKRLVNHTQYFVPDYDLEALEMAISALREQETVTNRNGLDWISVADRLPERDKKCLCQYTFGEKGRMYFYQVLDYYATDKEPHFQHTLGSPMRVTHWMPLPEPPKEEV